MIFKSLKFVAMASTVGLIAGGALFGREVCSYVTCSAQSIREAVKSSVPVEFQLRRAKELVNDIVPEMQANVRLIAQEEVEIDALKGDIAQSRKEISDERMRVATLRDGLSSAQVSFTFGDFVYTRDQLKDDLSRRFEGLKESEVVLSGKERLLTNRQQSLQAAMQALQRTRSQKSLLESQIAALEAQNQLVRAASVGSAVAIDNSKLSQSEQLIADIKKQLDVSERVLAHEANFVQPIQLDVVNEKDLLKQVDQHLASAAPINNDKPAQ